MSLRSLWLALVFVAACAAALPCRADEVDDVDKLYRSGKAEEALAKADAAIAAEPRAAQMRFLKGVMLTELKREDEALQVFVALTQDYPELADPYNNLAVIYASKGQLSNALAALQSALRNDPKHRAARENLGDVYLVLAQQAWGEARAESKGDDAELVRKLRLAQDILPGAAAPPPRRPEAARPLPPTVSPLRRSQGLDSPAASRGGS